MAQPPRRRPNSKKRRRGRHPGLYKALSAALILAAVVAACLIFFRVSQIEVVGNSRYTAEEIIDVAGVKTGNNLIAVRAARVSRELQGNLPYIRTVSVRRQLPGTLTIVVTESRAVAAVNREGGWWLMDKDGKLLEQVEGPGDCPVVTGLTPLAPAVGTYLSAGVEKEEQVEWLRQLLTALEENGLADRLDSVDLSEDYMVRFGLDGRFTVQISPALEKGMAYWIRRLPGCLDDSRVRANQNQRYTVSIMDDTNIRFIPVES